MTTVTVCPEYVPVQTQSALSTYQYIHVFHMMCHDLISDFSSYVYFFVLAVFCLYHILLTTTTTYSNADIISFLSLHLDYAL